MTKDYKKILFLRLDNKVGDTVVESFVPRELKKLYPNAELTIATTAFLDLLENDPYIDRLIYINRLGTTFIELLKILWFLRKQHYDLLIVPNLSIKRRIFIWLIKAKNIVSAHRALDGHITRRLAATLKVLGAQKVDITYELFINEKDKQTAIDFIHRHQLSDKKFIVLNPIGSQEHRTLSPGKIKNLIEGINAICPWPIVLLDYKNCYNDFNKISIRYTSNKIMETASLISHAEYVITVDTGITHIADTFHKKITVLFSLLVFPTQQEKQNHLIRWTPLTSGTKILYTNGPVDDISTEDIVQTVVSYFYQCEGKV